MSIRKNKAKIPGGAEVFKYVGKDWALYKITDEEYRLCTTSADGVVGYANYNLVIKDNKVQPTKDKSRLVNSRPNVFADLEIVLRGGEKINTSPDPYGDLLIVRGEPLSDEQRWKRRIMYIREKYLTMTLAGVETNVANAVVAHYEPIFKCKPSEQIIREVEAYVKRGSLPPVDTLDEVLRRYYAGEFKPHSMQNLEVQLDIICEVF